VVVVIVWVRRPLGVRAYPGLLMVPFRVETVAMLVPIRFRATFAIAG
jgi:hypothetical protein